MKYNYNFYFFLTIFLLKQLSPDGPEKCHLMLLNDHTFLWKYFFDESYACAQKKQNNLVLVALKTCW